jgi:plastocyanin
MMFLKKIFLFSLLLSLLISGIVRFSAGNTAFAGDPAQLITLKGESGMISPDSVKVKLGTTVVWYNSGPGPAKIVFITKIGLACSVPVNFYADLFGHYESTAIPVGGTASICFIGEGEYEYTVTRMISKGKDQPIEASAKGKIISVK